MERVETGPVVHLGALHHHAAFARDPVAARVAQGGHLWHHPGVDLRRGRIEPLPTLSADLIVVKGNQNKDGLEDTEDQRKLNSLRGGGLQQLLRPPHRRAQRVPSGRASIPVCAKPVGGRSHRKRALPQLSHLHVPALALYFPR